MAETDVIRHRGPGGRFAKGNAGGPGRPRRAVEHDYLKTLADAVSMADWYDITRRAVADAKTGDAKAREWLTRYLIGVEPVGLVELAADDADGHDGGAQAIEERRADNAVGRGLRRQSRTMDELLAGGPFDDADDDDPATPGEVLALIKDLARIDARELVERCKAIGVEPDAEVLALAGGR